MQYRLRIPFSIILTMVFCFFLCFTAKGAEHLNSGGNVNLPLSVDPTGKSEGFSAVLYDNTNGLPTSDANAIAETSDGFIWIGSYAGLIRYDGNTFERMDSTHGITSIKCLYVDSKDRLWIGTNDNGIAVMEKGLIRMWGKMDGMSSAHTRAIAEDENGTIYIATTCGITMIDKDLNLSSIEDEEVAEADMRYLRSAGDGTIYGNSEMGDLVIIKDGKLVDFISMTENPLGGAGVVLPDPDNPHMIYQEAADLGLYHVDLNGGFFVHERIDIDPLKYLLSMEYIDGKIWICAGNGIGVLEDGEFRLMDNLPMNNNVGHVMTDYLGNLWFASTRQGVMKVVPNQFSDIFQRYGIPQTVVNATAICEGKLFFATDTGIIILGDNGPLSEFPIKKAVTASGTDLKSDDLISLLNECRIRSVISDSKDRLWISTWRSCGLLCYDHGEVTAFTEEDGILSSNIRAVRECKDGSILVALTGGVNVIKDGKVTASYSREDGLDTDETLTVEEGFNGEIIAGSNGGGIYIIDDSGLKNKSVEDGLPSDIVMRLKKDTKRDLIWIVFSNAIAYMTPDYKVTAIQKFPYPNNFDLYENSEGDIWVLASNGIYVTPAEELLANGRINPVFYGISSGLPTISTANSYSALTPEGDLYIAGSTGVCKVNIDEPYEDVNELKAVVPFVEADEETIYPDKAGTITIPADTQKLTILGFVYNYSLNDPIVSYQLEGFDRHKTTVNRSELMPVDYTNLKGGTYYFKMQLMDSMGRGSKTVSVKIVKEKTFYEETWFNLIMMLVITALIILLVRIYVNRRMTKLERMHDETREQFEQTAEALANAIDAKDTYTNGHSRRVAEYSLKIAEEAGKSREECDQIYFAALLHDVGKIGVPMEILTKKGRLTAEEFEYIKQHPVVGGQILSSIKKSPWLSVGARYHHERINGRGYPEGLKGDDIPEIARIIAVADAYDAMTSNRSYRNAIPQHIVREELVKGIGTQFDPAFAKIMIHLIDLDTEYRMQESEEGLSLTPTTSLYCEKLYHDCTEGVQITNTVTRIHLCSQPDDHVDFEKSLPSLIIFDSLNGRVHPGEEDDENIMYYEYAKIRLDGSIEDHNTRKTETAVFDEESILEPARFGEPVDGQRYVIEAVRNRDHMQVRISDESRIIRVIIALPYTSRYTYLSLSGENCFIHNIRIEKDEDSEEKDNIPRIAEEISYIKGCPVGDVPNVQIDDWCSDATEGIRIEEGMILRFHSMSMPTARLVWHCPYISIFSSVDGQRKGDTLREYMLLRMNGEDWSSDENAENKVQISFNHSFEGWEAWKEKNKKGIDCSVEIRREGNRIKIRTENLGVALDSVTTIRNKIKDIYASITGDQCVITNVRFSRIEERKNIGPVEYHTNHFMNR